MTSPHRSQTDLMVTSLGQLTGESGELDLTVRKAADEERMNVGQMLPNYPAATGMACFPPSAPLLHAPPPSWMWAAMYNKVVLSL
jgi:hypothetical protein